MAVLREDTQAKCMKKAGFVDIVVKDIRFLHEDRLWPEAYRDGDGGRGGAVFIVE
ncbi:hypothetical protein QQZ08_000450 [Neonectria magnoliae]|uniref:Uncharacterized protein n=1 Tax=Neonectria magnoliae TaxID=2732573 RepID=A0ABR1IJB6_9HYPO